MFFIILIYFKLAVSSLLIQMIYLPAIVKIIYYDKVFVIISNSVECKRLSKLID